MKKTVKAPPKPTKEEEQRLDSYFYLPGWQFNKLIEDNCTEISSITIDWRIKEKEQIIIYGLMAMKSDTKKDCIANFFVKHENRTYQCYLIEQAIEMVELIKKEYNYDKYQSEIWKKQEEEKKKANILKSAKEKAA